MTEHRNALDPQHPETPERITEIWRVLEEEGLKGRCELVEVRHNLVTLIEGQLIFKLNLIN